ncbi:DUF6913 domain-containing protein [Flavobacterium taihuense]|uniref:Uncharacterized protein n=1 Tax=Flavobacterium taihuense TaxID=2857508 RepID=A0ABS6XYU8_9FLAO|nr:hypothetical protein [Flavobacterium taihuense]MBW4361456.1 hypothetical protein [Flavobacterium taihuense]
MFLKCLKSFLLNKTLKNILCNVKEESLNFPITRVGLIIDESLFFETAALKQEIVSYGLKEESVKVIVYRDVLNSKAVYSEPTFGLKDLNFKSEFTQQPINEFILDEFDLLINYYNEEKPFLLLLTHKTKAKFKVGFSSVDKRLNHFLINIDLGNYKGFTHELFRYLKILNKL